MQGRNTWLHLEQTPTSLGASHTRWRRPATGVSSTRLHWHSGGDGGVRGPPHGPLPACLCLPPPEGEVHVTFQGRFYVRRGGRVHDE